MPPRSAAQTPAPLAGGDVRDPFLCRITPFGGRIWTFVNNAGYIPSPLTEGPSAGQNAATLLRSNMEFESGEVTYEAYLKEPASACQVGLKSEGGDTVFAGLNVGTSAYGLAIFQNNRWKILASAGMNTPVPTGDWLPVKLRVLGSRIDLFVNEVQVCSKLLNITKGQVELFLQGSQDIIVRNIKATASKPQAFVVMQFSDAFNALYTEVIKPTCEQFGLKTIRSQTTRTRSSRWNHLGRGAGTEARRDQGLAAGPLTGGSEEAPRLDRPRLPLAGLRDRALLGVMLYSFTASRG